MTFRCILHKKSTQLPCFAGDELDQRSWSGPIHPERDSEDENCQKILVIRAKIRNENIKRMKEGSRLLQEQQTICLCDVADLSTNMDEGRMMFNVMKTIQLLSEESLY